MRATPHETATTIAHILFEGGALLNISNVLRNLDDCLEPASSGAFSLTWDSEDAMIAQFGQTRIILVVGEKRHAHTGFTLTIAVSPIDLDAISNPRLARRHQGLIRDLVDGFTRPYQDCSVLWHRGLAPVTVEIVEALVESLADRLAAHSHMPAVGTVEQPLPHTPNIAANAYPEKPGL